MFGIFPTIFYLCTKVLKINTMIEFEKEVVSYLNIPNIPKKEWNGKDSFQDGVAVLNLSSGQQAYAVCTFDKETDKKY